MPELKNKTELADVARRLAASYSLIQKTGATFIPVDWRTMSPDPPPPPKERIWVHLALEDEKALANEKFDVLFASDSELRNFDFMVRQFAVAHQGRTSGLLIRTDNGLKVLNSKGQLEDPSGEFTPNYIAVPLNESEDDKREVFEVITEWLGSEEEAKSLLHHLATALAPGWSAIKYVLLIGSGRNGKGVLLSMLQELIGIDNISNITRQNMAERSPTCVELNNKLLNIVFDGEMTYLKDSSAEKTIVAGEPLAVRRLYENSSTKVQTNALFVEGLNEEPKNRDKSSALQKRLMRYRFPRVYEVDKKFHQRMTGEQMIGAFLALLIDHYVLESEVAEKLAPTKQSIQLELEHVWSGSPVLQFLEHVHSTNPATLDRILNKGIGFDAFAASFRPWFQTQGGSERSDGDLFTMAKNHFTGGTGGGSSRHFTGVTAETRRFIEQLQQRGASTDASEHHEEQLVGD